MRPNLLNTMRDRYDADLPGLALWTMGGTEVFFLLSGMFAPALCLLLRTPEHSDRSPAGKNRTNAGLLGTVRPSAHHNEVNEIRESRPAPT